MKRVIALVLCIVCMAGVALGDAAESYITGFWVCDEFDWAIMAISWNDLYLNEQIAYWIDLRQGSEAVTVYVAGYKDGKLYLIDKDNKVTVFDKDGDTITNGKVHYTRLSK